jgi:hypothetical protein
MLFKTHPKNVKNNERVKEEEEEDEEVEEEVIVQYSVLLHKSKQFFEILGS